MVLGGFACYFVVCSFTVRAIPVSVLSVPLGLGDLTEATTDHSQPPPTVISGPYRSGAG